MLTHALLAKELWFIFQDAGELYIFSLLHSSVPFREDTAYEACHALCVVLQRDAFTPFCHGPGEQAFATYATWGLQTDTLQEPPPDTEGGYCHVQMTYEDTTSVLSAGTLEQSDRNIIALVERFASASSERHLIFATSMPARYACHGRPLHNVFAVFNVQIPDHLSCVFLILRGIGRDGFAAVLAKMYDTQQDVLDALGLDLPQVRGFIPYIAGCRRADGTFFFENGDVVPLHYVLEEAPRSEDLQMDESSDSESGSDDELDPDDTQTEGCLQTSFASSHAVEASQGPEAGPDQSQENSGGATEFMWNPAVQCDDAFDEGRQGDTSVGCFSTARIGDCNPSAARKECRRSSFKVMAWSLFGVIFLAHLQPLGAVILPWADLVPEPCDRFTVWPPWQTEGLNLRHSHVEMENRDSYSLQLGYGSEYNEEEDFFASCSTLLECAKGEEFYRTSLFFTLSALEPNTSRA